MKQIQMPSPIQQRIKILLWVCFLCLWFNNISSAQAGYVPPSDATPPSSSRSSTGVRGCGTRQTKASLTALAPRHHVGQTFSTHPTFVWFVPDSAAFPIEFQLYAVTTAGQFDLITSTQMQSSPGFMHFTLPDLEPGLNPRQRYVWQIIQFCDPDDLAAVSISGAEIEVVPSPFNSSETTAIVTDPLAQAERYAEAGFWYDALGLITALPVNARTEAFRDELLTNLADLEAAQEQENSEPSQSHSYSLQLQQIIGLP